VIVIAGGDTGTIFYAVFSIIIKQTNTKKTNDRE